MKGFCRCLILIVLAALFVGCAAQGPSVVPTGVIRSVDAAGNGDTAAFRIYTAYGQDKNGINTASTIVIKETPSMPGTPAKADLAYAQTAAQTGINKALVEQLIPAAATVAQGTVPGILIANAYRDSAKTFADGNKAAANALAQGNIEASKVQGLEAAKALSDPNNPANLPSNTTFNNNNFGNYQQQLMQQNQNQFQGQINTSIINP